MNANSLFTSDYIHLTGLLKHLNSEELKELLNDDEKSEAMIKDLKQIKDLEAEKEIIIASNKSLSEYNLSKKQLMENHRNQVQETHKIALELKNNLCGKKEKLEKNTKSLSGDTILALLQTATAQTEEEADATVELFLNCKLSAEDFLSKYLEQKKLAHLRRVKSEKLTTLLLEENGKMKESSDEFQRARKPPVSTPNIFANFLPSQPVKPTYNMTAVPVRQAPQPPLDNFNQGRFLPPSTLSNQSVGPRGPAYPLSFYPNGPGARPNQPFMYCSPYQVPSGQYLPFLTPKH